MQQQMLIQSPPKVKRGRTNNQDESEGNDEVISNKSSPGKIQSSQKEIDEFFENFQQQIQVKFLNFEDTIQDCDLQVKKCLNQIFETEIIKEKKQIQTFSARPPSAQKKNKLIYLNPFKNIGTIDAEIEDFQTINSAAPQPFNLFQDEKQVGTTSDFLQTTNLTNTDANYGGINKNNVNETVRNKEGFLPSISNGLSNYNSNFINNNAMGISSRFRAHSINDTASDQLHKKFIQQRNNCNTGDNIFSIKDHKNERQRILSNETRNVTYKNVGNFQQVNVVKHPYLQFMQNKETEQQQQQQNFMQSLRNAFRVTFNNPNQNQMKEQQKAQKNQPLLDFNKQQQLQSEFPQKQFGFQENQVELAQLNSVQTPTLPSGNNNNVKVFKRKDRTFRPSWNESIQNNNQNNNSFTNNNKKLGNENQNIFPTVADYNNQNIKTTQGQIQDQADLDIESSQKLIEQLCKIHSNKKTQEGTNNLNAQIDNFDQTERNLFGRLDTQVTQGFNSQTNITQKYRYLQTTATQANEDLSTENKTNPISDKPKKKVIKISKESVFCKIIHEQKEKQTKEGNTQLMLATKLRIEHNNKQRSHDFQETKLQPFQNQNFQIYQDQNLLQQYVADNQSLQQKVKMFKFTKKISNKTENAMEKTEQSYKGINQIMQDKENISENILNNLSQLNNNNDEQQQKREFKRNISFHRKNRSLNNEGRNQQQQNEGQNILIPSNNQKNNILQPKIDSPSQQDDQKRYTRPIQSNNKYDIDEIRNNIFLKKSTSSSLNTENIFFKNQLQTKQSEIGSCEKDNINYENFNGSTNYTQNLKDTITAQNEQYQKRSFLKQSSQFQDLTDSNFSIKNTIKKQQQCKQEQQQFVQNNSNLKTKTNPYEPSLERGQNKFNKQKTFNSILNGHHSLGINSNTKKFFGLNMSIEDMIIQNIDEFKEKQIRNQ